MGFFLRYFIILIVYTSRSQHNEISYVKTTRNGKIFIMICFASIKSSKQKVKKSFSFHTPRYLNSILHCEYCLHSHSKLSIYFKIVLLSNSNFGRVYLSIKKRRGCHGDAKRWHLHIYIAKRRNVIIYSCHLAVFVKGSVLTRSNSLVSHLRPKWAALKCVFCTDEG